MIQIYEFSTGIHVKGTADHWWSEGFTGYYMNSTLGNNIPEAVSQAIAEGLFSLSQSAEQQQPAIIGREVQSHNNNNDCWSVLAVITHANDESGRGISVTRYFLTQDLDKVSDLLNWYIAKARRPQFDPFNTRELDLLYNTDETKRDSILESIFTENDYQTFLEQPLIPSQTTTQYQNRNQNGTEGQGRLPEKALDQLAYVKARSSQRLVSWAYNVEGLKEPSSFLVIYPASHQAETEIAQALGSSSPISASPPPPLTHRIRTIIRNSTTSYSCTYDDLVTIGKAYSQAEIYTPEFWQQLIFEELGIDYSQHNNEVPPHIVALDTYHFLSLPNVDVREQNIGIDRLIKQKLDSQPYQVFKALSQAIQQNITDTDPNSDTDLYYIQQIVERVEKGILYLITQLLNHPEYLEIILDILLDDQGVWCKYFLEFRGSQTFSTKLAHDLTQVNNDKLATRRELSTTENLYRIQNSYRNSPTNRRILGTDQINSNFPVYSYYVLYNEIYQKLLNNTRILPDPSLQQISQIVIRAIWLSQKQLKPEKKIKGLAILFEQTSSKTTDIYDSRVAAFFYHLYKGKVPTAVWRRCQFTVNNHNTSQLARSRDEVTYSDNILSLPMVWTGWTFIIGFRKREQSHINNQRSHVNRRLLSTTRLYGIPIKREIGIGERTSILTRGIILFIWGILFKARKIPAFGLLVLFVIVSLLYFGPSAKISQIDPENETTQTNSIFRKLSNIKIINPFSRQNKKDGVNAQEFYENTTNVINQIAINICPEKERQPCKDAVVKILDPQKETKLNFDKKSEPEQQRFWIEAIQSYQTKANQNLENIDIKSTGIIEKDSHTFKMLQCQVQKNLRSSLTDKQATECSTKYLIAFDSRQEGSETKIPSDTASPPPVETLDTWERTITSLDTLRDELTQLGGDSTEIETKIVELLAPGTSFEYKNDHKDKWIPGIENYQQKILDKKQEKDPYALVVIDGIIGYNQNTYKVLKCEISSELKINIDRNAPELQICKDVLDND